MMMIIYKTKNEKMKYLFFLVSIYSVFNLCSCKGEKQESKVELKVVSNIIGLSDAIANMRDVKLSEIADTIIYLPLSSQHVVGDSKISLSDNFLFVGSTVFDWNGDYLFEMGSRGQGVGEEVYLHTMIEANEAFYSMADKLIAYDNKGKFSGTERLVVNLHPLDMGQMGTSGVSVCTLDSVFFLSKDFNEIGARRVVPDWPEPSTMMSSNRYLRFFTRNRDSVLFYNYINDTIFRVLDNQIQPRWVIDLKNDKIDVKYLLGNELKRLKEGEKYYNNGNLNDWEYLKDSDNKVRIPSVYESKKYVFLYWFRLFDLWQLRNLPPTVFQIAYYDKQTGETVAVGEEGFIDDISSLGTFFPLRGIHDNFMVASYWPYELKEKIDSLQQTGKAIDPRLKDLVNGVKMEDNPILVMVHLK